MLLLFQAIQEYLTEHHPHLQAIRSKYHDELFIESRVKDLHNVAHICRIIVIAKSSRIVTQHRFGTYNDSYTESTIIEQIENAIGQMYRPGV